MMATGGETNNMIGEKLVMTIRRVKSEDSSNTTTSAVTEEGFYRERPSYITYKRLLVSPRNFWVGNTPHLDASTGFVLGSTGEKKSYGRVIAEGNFLATLCVQSSLSTLLHP